VQRIPLYALYICLFNNICIVIVVVVIIIIIIVIIIFNNLYLRLAPLNDMMVRISIDVLFVSNPFVHSLGVYDKCRRRSPSILSKWLESFHLNYIWKFLSEFLSWYAIVKGSRGLKANLCCL